MATSVLLTRNLGSHSTGTVVTVSDGTAAALIGAGIARATETEAPLEDDTPPPEQDLPADDTAQDDPQHDEEPAA